MGYYVKLYKVVRSKDEITGEIKTVEADFIKQTDETEDKKTITAWYPLKYISP
jgi:hypothetical protein